MILYTNGDGSYTGWTNYLAEMFGAELIDDCEALSSNCRIIRTTLERIEKITPDFIVIGWASWEREEWLHGEEYWQMSQEVVNLSAPQELAKKYVEWVPTIDMVAKQKHWHQTIRDFHDVLKEKGIRHLFFNDIIPFEVDNQVSWKNHYLYPYDRHFTRINWMNWENSSQHPHLKFAQLLYKELTSNL